MLTFEESLNEVKSKKSFDYRLDTYRNILFAMEKQNPKKVEAADGGLGLCPCCHTMRHSYEKFCSECGQGLEW